MLCRNQENVRSFDEWRAGQLFASVSPTMHAEFCLQYELHWLEHFDLNCYDCCEPLHQKIGILSKIPLLRRISMSPWVDVDKGVPQVGRDYIFSYKPIPAFFAEGIFDLEAARRFLVAVMEKTRGCVVELIMKDVSTCRKDPRRLWDWCQVTTEVAEVYF